MSAGISGRALMKKPTKYLLVLTEKTKIDLNKEFIWTRRQEDAQWMLGEILKMIKGERHA
jgi:hypothetical protein